MMGYYIYHVIIFVIFFVFFIVFIFMCAVLLPENLYSAMHHVPHLTFETHELSNYQNRQS